MSGEKSNLWVPTEYLQCIYTLISPSSILQVNLWSVKGLGFPCSTHTAWSLKRSLNEPAVTNLLPGNNMGCTNWTMWTASYVVRLCLHSLHFNTVVHLLLGGRESSNLEWMWFRSDVVCLSLRSLSTVFGDRSYLLGSSKMTCTSMQPRRKCFITNRFNTNIVYSFIVLWCKGGTVYIINIPSITTAWGCHPHGRWSVTRGTWLYHLESADVVLLFLPLLGIPSLSTRASGILLKVCALPFMFGFSLAIAICFLMHNWISISSLCTCFALCFSFTDVEKVLNRCKRWSAFAVGLCRMLVFMYDSKCCTPVFLKERSWGLFWRGLLFWEEIHETSVHSGKGYHFTVSYRSIHGCNIFTYSFQCSWWLSWNDVKWGSMTLLGKDFEVKCCHHFCSKW